MGPLSVEELAGCEGEDQDAEEEVGDAEAGMSKLLRLHILMIQVPGRYTVSTFSFYP